MSDRGANNENPFRNIPSVDELLRHPRVEGLIEKHARAVVVGAAREVLSRLREAVGKGACVQNQEGLAAQVAEEVVREGRRELRRVVNATGIVLHTGLGRAVLPAAAIEALTEVAGGYSNLEIDLDTGQRGSRTRRVCELVCQITGAEAAAVVNNNAAATLLVLSVLAGGREVIVSRGQLIEIGGSYRLPDVMAASGAILREVGTTNRTRIGDYEAAITDQTALLLHVHTSNYRIVGFSETTPIEQIAKLAHERGLPAMDDIGSGALVDLTPYGLPPEPYAKASLAAGADVVTFSGDKLLGGPQAGIILAGKEIVRKLNASPLMRTYRLDKLTLAALEATLLLHRAPDEAMTQIPTLAMLAADVETLKVRARGLARQIRKAIPGVNVSVEDGVSEAGGGSLPACELPTAVVRVRRPAGHTADEIARRLRQLEPPVLVRLREESILLDPRTLRDDDAPMVRAALRHAFDIVASTHS